jgi:hypothetical protein
LGASEVVGCWAESLTQTTKKIAGNPDRRTEIRDPAKKSATPEGKRPTKPEKKRGRKKEQKTNNKEKEKKKPGKKNQNRKSERHRL